MHGQACTPGAPPVPLPLLAVSPAFPQRLSQHRLSPTCRCWTSLWAPTCTSSYLGKLCLSKPKPTLLPPHTPNLCRVSSEAIATLAPFWLLSLSQSSHSFRCHGSSGIFDLLSIHGGKLLSLGLWCSGRCALTSGLLSASSLLSPLHYPLMLLLDKCLSSELPPAHDALTVPKPRLFHGGNAV